MGERRGARLRSTPLRIRGAPARMRLAGPIRCLPERRFQPSPAATGRSGAADLLFPLVLVVAGGAGLGRGLERRGERGLIARLMAYLHGQGAHPSTFSLDESGRL